jgi:1-hydroxycarotenoid 3,4-desaturase
VQTSDRVVVVGAGLGGLSAALALAHAGLPVTVLEAQATPGGKMRCLPSPAGPVDAGPTVLTLRGVFDDLFASVGERLSDHVTLVPEATLARHWWPDGSTLDLHADMQISAAAIRDFAGPRAEAEFRAFTARAARLFDAFDTPMMRNAEPRLAALARVVMRDPGLIATMAPAATLAGSLSRSFSDPRLRQLFGRYATYVGGSPYASPALLALIWSAEARGVWRVAGGMHRLAQAMAALAAARGADLRYGSPVTRIETQGDRVAAVHLACGTRLAAGLVVFNGDPAALRRGLLGPAMQRAVPQDAVEPRSLSAHVWAFAANASGLQLAHHNVFFCTDPGPSSTIWLPGACQPTRRSMFVRRTAAPLSRRGQKDSRSS